MIVPPKINLLGLGISRVTYESATNAVLEGVREGRSMGVTALAVHGVMEGFQKPNVGDAIRALDVVTPDGQPVRWAMNLLGANEIRERVYGPTLTLHLCEMAAREQISVFFFGSKKEVLDKLVSNLIQMYPGLKVAGTQPDRFRDATPAEDEQDIQRINASGAGIVFVGRGCPRQELWVAAHLGKIQAAMIAVGAAFDFHAGTLPQAPPLLQKYGLEWLFRLVQEPRRLWKRYVILNPLYIYHFLRQWSGID